MTRLGRLQRAVGRLIFLVLTPLSIAFRPLDSTLIQQPERTGTAGGRRIDL
jgi:hypothetical protein